MTPKMIILGYMVFSVVLALYKKIKVRSNLVTKKIRDVKCFVHIYVYFFCMNFNKQDSIFRIYVYGIVRSCASMTLCCKMKSLSEFLRGFFVLGIDIGPTTRAITC